MAKVTVFTTVYNIAEYLPRFFECMERQSFSDYKHLIIDDGSEDESYEICKQQAEKDRRIKVVHVEHMGIASARNLALSMLDTQFTASADGDDVYEADYLLHLVKAQEAYDADLVISRVAYRNESYKKILENPEMGEMIIEKKDFPEMLPRLLENSRLNFLYGKLYRTEFLQDIRVEVDVKVGSDTMINSQYLSKIKRLALIDDMDANYIQYTSRSVTSYKGRDYYRRMFRIQKYLMSSFQSSGYLNAEMQRVIDKRIFQSLNWSLTKLEQNRTPLTEAIEVIGEMANDPLYVNAYERQMQRGNLKPYGFQILSPDEALPYYIEKKVGLLEKKLEKMEKERDQIEAQKKDLEEAINALEHSVSFRTGRILTFPGRKLRDLVKRKV